MLVDKFQFRSNSDSSNGPSCKRISKPILSITRYTIIVKNVRNGSCRQECKRNTVKNVRNGSCRQECKRNIVKNVRNGSCRQECKRDFVSYALFSQALLSEVITERQAEQWANHYCYTACVWTRWAPGSPNLYRGQAHSYCKWFFHNTKWLFRSYS